MMNVNTVLTIGSFRDTYLKIFYEKHVRYQKAK